MNDRQNDLRELLEQRIAVLDGAWGTMLQGAGLTPEDYRGDRIAGDHPKDVTGDPDLLNLTRPDVILTSTGSTSTPAPTSPPPTRSPRRASARPTTAWRASSAR